MMLEPGLPGLAEALAAFDFGGEVLRAACFGAGHINDTLLVEVAQPGGLRRFILQRINTHIFRDVAGLMRNIQLVTAHLREKLLQGGGDAERGTLRVIPTREGAPYTQDSAGGCWRLYPFIEGTVCHERVTSPALFAACARAFGGFSQMLADFPAGALAETIPNFHDTRVRLRDFQSAVAADTCGRAAECRQDIDFVLARAEECGTLMNLLDEGVLPLRVTHNDTKLSNVLVDKTSGEGVCVIDLDTVMPGLSLHDFGDAIRCGANTAPEDAQDIASVRFSLELFEVYTRSYIEVAGAALTQQEKQLLPMGAKLMTLECGMRFLADYLEGDVYFRRRRPGQNRDRARTQFKLVRDMEHAWAHMQDIVFRITET